MHRRLCITHRNRALLRPFAFLIAMASPLVLALSPVPTNSPTPPYPKWWFQRDVVARLNSANNSPAWPGDYPASQDYAALTEGQLLNLATAAYDELQANLPGGGAGSEVATLVKSWFQVDGSGNFVLDSSGNRIPIITSAASSINLGQLKNVAHPFYDRLKEVGYTSFAPWENAGTPADYTGANLGQAKSIFSFDVTYSSTGGPLPDWWQMKYFGTLGVDPGGIPSGATLTYLQMYQQGVNPWTAASVTVAKVAGDNQASLPGQVLQPLQVQVSAGGAPVGSAPVTFTVTSGGGGLVSDPTDDTQTPASTLNAVTDPTTGLAVAYYWQPSTASTASQISADSGAATAVQFSATTLASSTQLITLSPSNNMDTTDSVALQNALAQAGTYIQQGATAVTINLTGGQYTLLPPATTPLAPAVLISPSTVATSESGTITIQNANTASLSDQVVFSGAYEFTGGAVPSVGTWSQPTITSYDGGTTDTAQPNGRAKSVTVQKLTFNTDPNTGAAWVRDLVTRLKALHDANVNGGIGGITQLFVKNVSGDFTRRMRSRHPNFRSFQADTQDFSLACNAATPPEYTGPSSLLGYPYFYAAGQNPMVPFVGFNENWYDTIKTGSTFNNNFAPILDGKTEVVFSRCDVQAHAPISLTAGVTLNGTTTVTMPSPPAGMAASKVTSLVTGGGIFGPGIPAGATITSFLSSTQMTISAAATLGSTSNPVPSTVTFGAAFNKSTAAGDPRIEAVLGNMANPNNWPSGVPNPLPSYYPPNVISFPTNSLTPLLPPYDQPLQSGNENLQYDEEYQKGGVAGMPAISSIEEANATFSQGAETFPASGNSHVEESWNRGWLENNLAFVDAPGEWYFDESGLYNSPPQLSLYYVLKSGETLSNLVFHLPVAYTLMALRGTETQPVVNVRIIGQPLAGASTNSNTAGSRYGTGPYPIVFEHGAWKYENQRGNSLYAGLSGVSILTGMIDGYWVGGSQPPQGSAPGDGLVVELCEFAHYGGNAVALGGNRAFTYGQDDRAFYDHQVRGRTVNVLISNNYFTDAGGGGIILDDYPRLDPSRSYIVRQGPMQSISGQQQYPNPIFTGMNVPGDCNQITYNTLGDSTEVTSGSAALDFGQVFYDAAGITVMHFFNTSITNNKVSNLPYDGILAGEGAQRIRNLTGQSLKVRSNSVDYAMRALVDGGGIYTGGGANVTITSNAVINTGARTVAEAVLIPSNLTVVSLVHDIYLDAETSVPVAEFNTVGSNILYDVQNATVASNNLAGTPIGTGLRAVSVPLPGEDLGPWVAIQSSAKSFPFPFTSSQTVTGGTFTLTDVTTGQTTAALAYNASASTVQAAIRSALTTNFGSATVVNVGASVSQWTVDRGAAGAFPDYDLVCNTSQITPSNSVSLVQAGLGPNGHAVWTFTLLRQTTGSVAGTPPDPTDPLIIFTTGANGANPTNSSLHGTQSGSATVTTRLLNCCGNY